MTRIHLEFKRQNFWIGLLWKRSYSGLMTREYLEFWVCLLPMLPIYICRERILSEDEQRRVIEYMAGERR